MLKAIFKLKELRHKILFVIFIILIYRLGSHIPIPGVNLAALEEIFSNNSI